MKWSDFFNQNFSRKAEIVIATLTALIWVGTIQADESKVIYPEIIKLAEYGIIGIGAFGIFAQGVIDFKYGPAKNGNEKPEQKPEATEE